MILDGGEGDRQPRRFARTKADRKKPKPPALGNRTERWRLIADS